MSYGMFYVWKNISRKRKKIVVVEIESRSNGKRKWQRNQAAALKLCIIMWLAMMRQIPPKAKHYTIEYTLNTFAEPKEYK